MTPQTVNVVCAKSKLPCVPAVRRGEVRGGLWLEAFYCSWCGARVKVVA